MKNYISTLISCFLFCFVMCLFVCVFALLITSLLNSFRFWLCLHYFVQYILFATFVCFSLLGQCSIATIVVILCVNWLSPIIDFNASFFCFSLLSCFFRSSSCSPIISHILVMFLPIHNQSKIYMLTWLGFQVSNLK